MEQLPAAQGHDLAQQFRDDFPGWQPVFDDLCREIEHLCGEARHRFGWLQLKEKSGSARLYWCTDGIRFGASASHEMRNLATATIIDTLVTDAEQKTEWLCSKCGGYRDKRSRHWLSGMCDACAQTCVPR